MDMMPTEAHPFDTGPRLRKVVAEFFAVDEGEVGPTFSLQTRRGQGSIARAALDSLIRRRVGLTSHSVYSARTYGELEAELLPEAASGSPAMSPVASGVNGQSALVVSAAGAVRCGIDIELIDHLPRVADCWEDPFYRDHFAPAEIAYCQLQETPALHFAARWCAKEALKKCDGAFLPTAMKDIEVVTDEIGSPVLVHHSRSGARRLPHAVSLSHTEHAAVAVVVSMNAVAALPPAHDLLPAPPLRSTAPSLHRSGLLPILLSVVALGVAIGALVRTFWIVR
jgi:holo-[acyl-carrier protein] synthase